MSRPKISPETAADALLFAKQWLTALNDSEFIAGSGLPALDARAGEWFVRNRLVKDYALFGSPNMSHIISLARAGWGEADTALRELISDLTEHQQPLPAALTNYCAEKPPAKKRGQHRSKNLLQNVAIVVLIIELNERFGLAETRRTSSSRHSASSVVAEALTGLGIGRPSGHKAIEKVWERWSPTVLKGFNRKPPGTVKD